MEKLIASQKLTKSQIQIVARLEKRRDVEAQEVVDTTVEGVAVADVAGEVEEEASRNASSHLLEVVECLKMKTLTTVKDLAKMTLTKVQKTKKVLRKKKTVPALKTKTNIATPKVRKKQELAKK